MVIIMIILIIVLIDRHMVYQPLDEYIEIKEQELFASTILDFLLSSGLEVLSINNYFWGGYYPKVHKNISKNHKSINNFFINWCYFGSYAIYVLYYI